jgi:hypothetical protein
MKLLVMQFSPPSHQSTPFWSKYSPQQDSDIESIRSLHLAAVKIRTVPITELPLKHMKLCKARTYRGLVYCAREVSSVTSCVRYLHLTKINLIHEDTTPSCHEKGRYVKTVTARVRL